MNADYKILDRTVTTRELVVETPLDWKNFNWIVHQLGTRLQEAGLAGYDDACKVTVGDDEIIFSWQLSDKTDESKLW